MLRRRTRYAASHEPRVEMTPLLDVIFLLLTFFIYSIVLTVRAQVLPVTLPTLTTGQTPREVKIAGVTVDREGKLFLNREPVDRAVLEAKLKELSAQPQPPKFFLAVDAGEGEVDRAPILLEMIEIFRRAKIQDLNIVGQPAEPTEPHTP